MPSEESLANTLAFTEVEVLENILEEQLNPNEGNKRPLINPYIGLK